MQQLTNAYGNVLAKEHLEVAFPLQEIATITSALGATLTAVVKGREIVEWFKPKKRTRLRRANPRKRDDVDPCPTHLDRSKTQQT
jgi:hypothetical protein